MRCRFLFVFLFVALIPWNVWASLYFDLEGFSGYGKPKVSGGGTSPSSVHFGVGFTLGYYVSSSFFVGLKNEFRSVEQISRLDTAVGNFRGSYLSPAGPTLGLNLYEWTTKLDFKLFEEYKFSNESASEEEVFLRKPLGWRISIGYKLLSWAFLGFYYEQLKFRQSLDTATAVRDLSPAQDLSQMGIFLLWRHGGNVSEAPVP